MRSYNTYVNHETFFGLKAVPYDYLEEAFRVRWHIQRDFPIQKNFEVVSQSVGSIKKNDEKAYISPPDTDLPNLRHL